MNILKEYVKLQSANSKWYKTLKRMREDESPKIILIGTPVHGNLGDHAIAEEEKIFLNDFFPEYNVYEILMPMFHVCKRQIKKNIKNVDVIIISGGGWMGNLWIHNEITIREIIQSYPENLIVIFPQTVFYTDDINGDEECKITSKIISKHKNLQLFLRDQKSFEFVQENYIFSGFSGASLFPDMVLYGRGRYATSEYIEGSKLINVCLRNDCEGMIKNKDELIDKISKNYFVRKITTVVPYRVPLKNRKKELTLLWNEFSEAKLTITDRLHAMLFSVLNGTPCIAIDNKTGKVFGVLSWIDNSGMILRATSIEDVLLCIPKAMKMEKRKYNKGFLSDEFIKMAEKIKKGIRDNED